MREVFDYVDLALCLPRPRSPTVATKPSLPTIFGCHSFLPIPRVPVRRRDKPRTPQPLPDGARFFPFSPTCNLAEPKLGQRRGCMPGHADHFRQAYGYIAIEEIILERVRPRVRPSRVPRMRRARGGHPESGGGQVARVLRGAADVHR